MKGRDGTDAPGEDTSSHGESWRKMHKFHKTAAKVV